MVHWSIRLLPSIAFAVGDLRARPAAANAQAAPAQAAPASRPPRVITDAGAVEGAVDSATGVLVFRGIPFAAPPVDDLRWRPPRAVAPWSGVRNATAFGRSCIQAPLTDGGLPAAEQAEDCLYLNVWTPGLPDRGRSATKRPVMVWIHGGAFREGSGSVRLYDGAALARKGVVLVTFNYRLGPLGYLGHPAFAAEDPHGSAGNYGLLDQLAALEWVRRNAARFGGDSARVTVFGESAGGHSVGALLVSPRAQGLFHRAILQSGSGIPAGVVTPRDDAEARALLLAATAGVRGTDARAAAALRSLDVRVLVGAERRVQDSLVAAGRLGRLGFVPALDGWALPLRIDSAIARGRWNRVPVIVGSNADEGTFFVRALPAAMTVERWRASVGPEGIGEAPGALERLYPAADTAQLLRAMQGVWRDRVFGAPSRALARLVAGGGGRAWYYHFTRVGDGEAARAVAATHMAEIPFAFGRVPRPGGTVGGLSIGRTPFDSTLAAAMSDYWVAFAASGDPNGPPAAGKWPRWPAYDARSDAYLEFGGEILVKQRLRPAQYDLFDALARARGEIRP